MEASSSYSSHFLSLPFPGKSRHRKINDRKSAGGKIFATRRDSSNGGTGGNLVDENMIVLRKRIHEMKMIERSNDPPSNWMDWEKKYHANYDSDICEAMGLLQSLLMNTRPSLALGITALIAMSVPTATVLILFQLMKISKGILYGFH